MDAKARVPLAGKWQLKVSPATFPPLLQCLPQGLSPAVSTPGPVADFMTTPDEETDSLGSKRS